MTFQIRRLASGDEALFDRVAEGVFDYAIDGKRLADYLAEPNHHLIVALSEGRIVGQVAAVVHKHPDGRATELYIDEVAVAPAFQRQGIARRMLDAMLALGKTLGCDEAWVGTEHDNIPALNLYASRDVPPQPFVMYVFDL